jgi:hypothetical protein
MCSSLELNYFAFPEAFNWLAELGNPKTYEGGDRAFHFRVFMTYS